jgi:hypothetical protein
MKEREKYPFMETSSPDATGSGSETVFVILDIASGRRAATREFLHLHPVISILNYSSARAHLSVTYKGHHGQLVTQKVAHVGHF